MKRLVLRPSATTGTGVALTPERTETISSRHIALQQPSHIARVRHPPGLALSLHGIQQVLRQAHVQRRRLGLKLEPNRFEARQVELRQVELRQVGRGDELLRVGIAFE